MKPVIKLNSKQLRVLISEAIRARRAPGTPLQDDAVQLFTDAIEDDWREQVRAMGSSIDGEGSFSTGNVDRQLQRAVMDLAVEVHNSLEKIWDRLVQGQYQ